MRTSLIVAFALGVLVTLGAGAIAGHETFTDVPEGHTHEDGIHWVANRGVMGHPDGTYRPGDPVTRGQMASMLRATAGVQFILIPDCGSREFGVRELKGQGSGGATVEYSVDGGDRFMVDAVPAEGDMVFEAHASGVVTLFVDGVAHATAHTSDDCTPPGEDGA
jgi:hypothetical protein